MHRLNVGWIPHDVNPVFAGVRYRCLYPMRRLNSMGVNAFLFDDKKHSHYDVVVVQCKWLFDSISSLELNEKLNDLREIKGRYGCRVVVDGCDNYFFNPDMDQLTSDKSVALSSLFEIADCVVAASEQLAEEYKKHLHGGAVVVIGDPVEEKKDTVYGESILFRVLNFKRWSGYLLVCLYMAKIKLLKALGYRSIVWFGNHGTKRAESGMKDVLRIKSELEEVSKNKKIILSIISNSEDKFNALFAGWQIKTHYHEWNRVTFHSAIQQSDLVIIPTGLNEFSKHKGNNRLALALSLGIPVAADSLESYKEFSDFCCLDNWANIDRLLDGGDELRAKVAKGKAYVMKHYSHKAIAAQWHRLFVQVVTMEKQSKLVAEATAQQIT